MAEVVGLVTGVAGLAPLIKSVVSGTKRLQRIRRDSATIPVGLNSLLKDLDFLQLVMKKVNAVPYTSGADYRYCQELITPVATAIEELLDKYPLGSVSSGKKPNLKDVWGLRHWEEDVKSLRETVNKAKQDLSLYLQTVQVELISGMIEARDLGTSSSSEASSSFGPMTESEALSSSSLVKFKHPLRAVRQDCAIKTCSCSCHRSSRISRQFWSLDYTGLFPPGNKCDQPTCTASAYGFRLRVALSQLGIPWSVTMGLRLLAGIGSFSIQPALQAERIVPYTSLGFEIIWRVKHRFMNADEACIAFRKLAQEDPSLHLHVDPSGSSYVETLLEQPWGDMGLSWMGDKGRWWLNVHLSLLRVLMCELKVARGTKNKSFLVKCAGWANKNVHLALLETALESGFDPTTIDSPHFSEWSRSSLFHTSILPGTLDPFFLQLLALVCKNNQGFAGMTPLHEAVLFGQPEDVHHWAKRSEKNERNFLGQTPLHLAVCKPQHLQTILDADHGPDATDAYGLMPLMYSVVSNAIDAARILIRAGADLFTKHTTHNLTFTGFAVARHRWDFIMKLFSFFDDEAMHNTSEVLAQEAVSLLFLSSCRSHCKEESDCLLHLLSRCKSLNITPVTLPGFERDRVVEGRTLLHYAGSVSDVDALLDQSSSIINQVDHKGQDALMSVVAQGELSDLEPLVRRLLDAGADINLQDKRGHTACHIMMQRLSQYVSFPSNGIPYSLHTLVSLGADVLRPDNCKCSCSVSGCLPTVPGISNTWLSPRGPAGGSVFLLMEWTILIFETCGIETARQSLLATIRLAQHKKLDMTHTCCQRRNGSFDFVRDHYPDSMPDDDIDEILEEESEFNEILDHKMEQESEREFNTLLRNAILDTKHFMDQAIRRPKAIQYILSSISSYRGYHVDHENDRFVPEYEPDPPDAPKLREIVIKGIASYALWLEEQLRRKDSSEEMKVNSWRVGYLRRLSWLYHICNVFEVSTEELVEELRRRAADPKNQPDEKKTINGDVQHFCESWEEWIAKGPAMGVDSTDGFADWPLEEASD